MKFSLHLAGVIFGVTGLTACSSSGPDPKAQFSEATQQAAYQQCSTELNVRAQLQRIPLRGGAVNVFAVNGNGVSLVQARSLNQCAQAKLSAT